MAVWSSASSAETTGKENVPTDFSGWLSSRMTVSSESKEGGKRVSSVRSLHFLQSFEFVILAASVENSKMLFSSQLER